MDASSLLIIKFDFFSGCVCGGDENRLSRLPLENTKDLRDPGVLIISFSAVTTAEPYNLDPVDKSFNVNDEDFNSRSNSGAGVISATILSCN